MQVAVVYCRGQICDVIQAKDTDAVRHYLMGLCIKRAYHPEVSEMSLVELARWITQSHHDVKDYEVHIVPVTEL